MARLSEHPELLTVYRADYLQQAMTAGWLPPEFLVENISSDQWYRAMMRLATRLRDAETLREIIAGMSHRINPTRTYAAPLVIGLGNSGIEVIKALSATATVEQESLLAVDIDSYTLKQCDGTRKLTIPFGQAKFFGWAGVHHGGVDHRRMLTVAAVPKIAKELDSASQVVITLALGGALGTGAAPVIAAECQNLDIPVQVVAILPLKFRPMRAIQRDPLHWRESLHVVDLLRRLGARVELLSSEKVLKELPNGGPPVSLREFHELMTTAMLGRVVAKVSEKQTGN